MDAELRANLGAAVAVLLCCALKRAGTDVYKQHCGAWTGNSALAMSLVAYNPNLKNPKPHASLLPANSCCRYDFDIPILAMDLVAAGGAVTLAIIDACPVSPRLTLPQHYSQTMLELQHEFLPGGGGAAVCSKHPCGLKGV